MDDPLPAQEFKTNPEEAAHSRRQVWLILLVMLASSCLGIAALTVILWWVFTKLIPSGLI